MASSGRRTFSGCVITSRVSAVRPPPGNVTVPSIPLSCTKSMRSPLQLHPVGVVRSPLRTRDEAPRQGDEGAPEAWLELDPAVAEAARELRAGSEVLVLTWLDRGDRSVLAVHPRDDAAAPLTGVFSTRSQDRPNPIGLHRCRILEVAS